MLDFMSITDPVMVHERRNPRGSAPISLYSPRLVLPGSDVAASCIVLLSDFAVVSIGHLILDGVLQRIQVLWARLWSDEYGPSGVGWSEYKDGQL